MKRLKLLSLALASAIVLPAQTGTASFSGTIADPAGGVLPGVDITIASPDTGFQLTAQTAPDGVFHFPSLAPGAYSVNIKAQGFAQRIIKALVLSASEVINQTIALELETVSARIEVNASAAGVRIQTGEAQISRVLTLKEMEVLPQIGRDPMQLVLYSPGVLRDGGYSRINGTRNGSSNTKQDGIGVTDSV